MGSLYQSKRNHLSELESLFRFMTDEEVQKVLEQQKLPKQQGMINSLEADKHGQITETKQTNSIAKAPLPIVFRLAKIIIGLVAVIFLGFLSYTAVRFLTLPTLIIIVKDSLTFSTAGYAVLILEGCLAGLLIGFLRKAFKMKSKFSENVISEVVSFKTLKLNRVFISTAFLSVCVATIISVWNARSGAVGLLDLCIPDHIEHILFLPNSTSTLLDFLNSGKPLLALTKAGGDSGSSPSQVFIEYVGLKELAWISAIYWVIAVTFFVIQGIIIGALIGFVLGIISGAIGGTLEGALKGSVISAATRLVLIKNYRANKLTAILYSAIEGAIEGAIVGAVVSLIQILATLIALHR